MIAHMPKLSLAVRTKCVRKTIVQDNGVMAITASNRANGMTRKLVHMPRMNHPLRKAGT